ncbi:hypothetical protein BDB00DRAFT_796836 [Zychaea mexicana]|uniref:uncharacterized protein n=1 Tax=Zychaea mexicana TaxID=64656 RepID=UPI0022FDD4A1|nr:uncharacterized protein BDB00DRAFT_796836 [Zychaea mexicana]KAI9498831.1 hypothetical protein BDB00DRAFT_796836 [Zychaea mexicana]
MVCCRRLLSLLLVNYATWYHTRSFKATVVRKCIRHLKIWQDYLIEASWYYCPWLTVYAQYQLWMSTSTCMKTRVVQGVSLHLVAAMYL